MVKGTCHTPIPTHPLKTQLHVLLLSFLPRFCLFLSCLPPSYLLEHGAFPALVNNEGDTPLDLAEDYEEIVDMLQNKVEQDMIDLKAVKGVEEMMMLEDANRLKNDPNLTPVISHGGATPLHVAAAKNYVQIVKCLVVVVVVVVI